MQQFVDAREGVLHAELHFEDGDTVAAPQRADAVGLGRSLQYTLLERLVHDGAIGTLDDGSAVGGREFLALSKARQTREQDHTTGGQDEPATGAGALLRRRSNEE